MSNHKTPKAPCWENASKAEQLRETCKLISFPWKKLTRVGVPFLAM